MSSGAIDLEGILKDFVAIEGLQTLPTDQAVARDLAACGACGETIRKGLVRCSECNAFTRPEIEATYRDMVGKRQQA
jgi:hypothetical protein